jgi:hypothetical protein
MGESALEKQKGPVEDLNFFDGILYINLERRQDRKRRILGELKRLHVHPSKIHRINAIHDPANGHRGCALSHQKALDFAIEKKWNNLLILEDDCVFSKEEEVQKAMRALISLENGWDAFLFGGDLALSEEASFSDLLRVRKALRAHAYAVQSHYFPQLRSCYEEAIESMQNILFFFDSLPFAIDRRWQLLQRDDRWYAPKKLVAFQGSSFSDICCMDLFER